MASLRTLLLFLVLCTSARAQERTATTKASALAILRDKLNSAVNDEERLQVLLEIPELVMRDSSGVAGFLNTMRTLSERVGTKVARADFIYQNARFQYAYFNKTAAKEQLEAALEIYRGENEHLKEAGVLNQLGYVAFQERDYEGVYRYAEEQLAAARIANDQSEIGTAYMNLGLANKVTGNRQKAKKYYTTALDKFEEAKDTGQLKKVYQNLANIYNTVEVKSLDTALMYNQRAIDLTKASQFEDVYQIAELYTSRARFLARNGQLDEALVSGRMALEGHRGIASTAKVYNDLYYLGSLNRRTNNFAAARSYFDEALRLARSDEEIDPTWLYFALGEYHRVLGDADSTGHYFQLYGNTIASQARKNENVRIAKLESQFEIKEQKIEIDRLALEDDLNRARLSRQSWIIIGGLITLGIFAAALYFLMRQRRRIRAQNQLIQKSLEEKEVLVKEIHHRVKNNLQMVSSLLSLQSRYISDAGAVAALKMGNSRVRSMALIHQRLYLENEIGTRVNAKDYLEKLADELVKNLTDHHQRIDLQMEIDDLELDIDTMIPLGLIANELITNALKYAFEGRSEGRLSVVLTKAEHWIKLLTEDDGPGFTVDPAANPNTFGYLLINNLVDQLEGNLFVDGREGTRVRIEIPSPGSNT